MLVKDLRARHIKGIMDDGYVIPSHGKDAGHKVPASSGTKARIKSLFNLMLDYALEYELVDKNYARTFDLSNDIIKDGHASVFSMQGKFLTSRKRFHIVLRFSASANGESSIYSSNVAVYGI